MFLVWWKWFNVSSDGSGSMFLVVEVIQLFLVMEVIRCF